MTTTLSRMKQKRGTAAEWATQNPILDDGEMGFEEDTKIFKLGDGSTHWNDLHLPYVPVSMIAAKGDLFVGAGSQSIAKLARGAEDQRLTVNPDGSLGWTDMPEIPIPRLIEKPADLTRSTPNSVTGDPDLVLSVEAHKVYLFEALLYFINTNTGAPFLLSLLGSGAMTFSYAANGPVNGGGLQFIKNAASGVGQLSFTSTANGIIAVRGRIKTNESFGFASIGWGQQNAASGGTKLLANSYFSLTETS